MRLVSVRAMSKDLQVEEAMEKAWQMVESEFEVGDIFGAYGAMFLREMGAKACLHPLAVAMPVMSALAALTNGASVRLWSEPSPLCIASVLVNPPQSRKSQTTAIVCTMGKVLDEFSEEM